MRLGNGGRAGRLLADGFFGPAAGSALNRHVHYHCCVLDGLFEPLEQVNDHQVVYQLPKPRRDGRTAPALIPLELIDSLAALITPLSTNPVRRRSAQDRAAPSDAA